MDRLCWSRGDGKAPYSSIATSRRRGVRGGSLEVQGRATRRAGGGMGRGCPGAGGGGGAPSPSPHGPPAPPGGGGGGARRGGGPRAARGGGGNGPPRRAKRGRESPLFLDRN